MSLLLLVPAIKKTVFLVVIACTGDVRDQNCGDEFNAESWVATTYAEAKQECEVFLRDEFDPKNYLTLVDDDYAAVRCE